MRQQNLTSNARRWRWWDALIYPFVYRTPTRVHLLPPSQSSYPDPHLRPLLCVPEHLSQANRSLVNKPRMNTHPRQFQRPLHNGTTVISCQHKDFVAGIAFPRFCCCRCVKRGPRVGFLIFPIVIVCFAPMQEVEVEAEGLGNECCTCTEGR